MRPAAPEWIFRLSSEKHYILEPLKRQTRDPYPWETRYNRPIPKITKEYFRCKGNNLNPLKTLVSGGDKGIYLFDCGGSEAHSLPLKEEREFIYPILIDLLNFIQEKTRRRVVITCGHRCPVHNRYVDPGNSNQSSKHQIGAEVDFYVEGTETQPLKIVELILAYYREEDPCKRYQNQTDVSTEPWYNKEIFVKLYKEYEGRDLDNSHPYPYITLQVRYDRELNRPIHYNWHCAHNGYRRL